MIVEIIYLDVCVDRLEMLFSEWVDDSLLRALLRQSIIVGQT